MIKSIIFDLDGVLWLSEKGHRYGYLKALNFYNITEEELLEISYFGKPTENVIKEILFRKGVFLPEKSINTLIDEKRKFTYDFLIESKPINHTILNDFKLLKDMGLKIAIVTSSSKQNLNTFLSCLSKDVSFDVMISISDVKVPKPSPDSYKLALSKLSCIPKHAKAIEDTELGKLAANAAGIDCFHFCPTCVCETKLDWPHILKCIQKEL